LVSRLPRLPGVDNRTMHASYGNAILLKDTPEETTRKVMDMYTDPTRVHASDPGHVEDNPLFTYLDAFDADREAVEQFKARYRAGKVGDVEIKRHLAQALNGYLAPLRQRRASFMARADDLRDLLRSGTERAKGLAQATLAEVQKKMGLR
jgi:tryptophanyl-tRNA synthetase